MVSATGRFVAQFLGAGRAADEREVLLDVGDDVGDERRAATLYLTQQPARPAGTWILLHGMAAPGRHHGAVRSMARAFAAAGRRALVPEVPLWTSLRVRPSEAEPSIRAALAWIDEDAGLPAARVGLMGFSVAGTWALEAAAGELPAIGSAPSPPWRLTGTSGACFRP